MSEKDKWAAKLSSQCGLSEAFLKYALEELSESCYGDARTSQDILKELTMSCHMDEKEVKRFLSVVSKNCPMDAEKLRDEIAKAEGDKRNVFETAERVGTRGSVDRTGAR